MQDMSARWSWTWRLGRTVALLGLLVALAACDTAEDRAERHYQSALALLEKGDVDRAIIEFRNVFDLNGRHREARAAFAGLLRDRGDANGAAAQYLRLVEQYPDDVPGNLALAELNAEAGNWADVDRHVAQLVALDPRNSRALALQVVSAYQAAVGDQETEAAQDLARQAAEMRAGLPGYVYLQQVVIDDAFRNQRFREALDELDVAIEDDPGNEQLYSVRLSILGAMGDPALIEEHLKRMVELFPADRESRLSLVRWHITQGQLDAAEALLRAGIGQDFTDPTDRLTLLRFLAELRGREVAVAEIDRMAEAGQATPTFLSVRAALIFEAGERERAIADLETLVGTLQASDETNAIKVSLAGMYDLVGRRQDAERLVDEVLSADRSEVAALKMRAGWLIEADRTGDAIVALRTALDQSPQDPEILTIMAQAHERDGNRELVGEMLSLAVQAANKAPDESSRYADYLLGLGKFGPAEAILVDALRLAPADMGILTRLGRTYIGLRDWPRTDQVIATLRRLETPEAEGAANALHAEMLRQSSDINAAVTFLEGLVSEGSAGFDANTAIVRGYLLGGEPEKARAYVDRLIAEGDDSRDLLFLDAGVDAAAGNPEAAEGKYRALLARDDRDLEAWVALFRLLMTQGRVDDAEATYVSALAVFPDEPVLLWIKASFLEQRGDMEGAIAVYEDLYRRDSANMLVANNLASLLSIQYSDTETLQRAYTIARRLRLTSVPPYLDTYGWIAFLRGDLDEALEYLVPAAEGLPDEPTVQYHLARARLAKGQEAEALAAFRRTVELTTAADSRPFVVEARAEALRLEQAVDGKPGE